MAEDEDGEATGTRERGWAGQARAGAEGEGEGARRCVAHWGWFCFGSGAAGLPPLFGEVSQGPAGSRQRRRITSPQRLTWPPAY